MKIFFFVLILITSKITKAQSSNDCQHTCDYLYESISYFWKLDSLGTNGFRNEVHKCLFSCYNDSLNKEFILSRLGKPNESGRDSNSDYLIYHYFNGRLLPKEAGFSMEFFFIIFRFTKGKTIKSIAKGHYD